MKYLTVKGAAGILAWLAAVTALLTPAAWILGGPERAALVFSLGATFMWGCLMRLWLDTAERAGYPAAFSACYRAAIRTIILLRRHQIGIGVAILATMVATSALALEGGASLDLASLP